VQAIGARYNGRFDPDGRGGAGRIPAVSMMGIWNEPNSAAWLLPQFRGSTAYSPVLYRRLFEAARRGLAAAGWRGTVLAGETTPAGSAAGTMPVEFMRQVLCLPPGIDGPPSCPPLQADGWSHHPYGFGVPPWVALDFPPGLVSIGSIGRLTDALGRAERAGAGTLPLYITEFGYESAPDPAGLPLHQQAEFISAAEKIAYDDPHIASFAQYLMRDDPPYAHSFIAFESGLRLHRSVGSCDRPGSRCKPSWFAFRTPLAVRLNGDRAELWGRVRPVRGSTTVTILGSDGPGSLFTLANVQTDPGGYFTFSTPAATGRQWAVDWEGHIGPLTSGYNY
jgi:hypothetical protein